MMKKLIYCIVLALPLWGMAQNEKITVADISWYLDFNKAMDEAQDQDKNLLVYFTGSDWCAPCQMLKSDLFKTDAFRDVSGGYILLYVDIPRNQDLLSSAQLAHNKALLPKLNKKNVFPLFTVLDRSGDELDQISGYNMNGEIRYHLDFMKRNQ